jgi:drug/metabolite transporter (DMT)-like permease
MTFAESRLLLSVFFYIGCNVAGDLTLSHGLRQMGPFAGAHPAGLLHFLEQVATTPAVIVGTALEAGAYAIFLSMLSEADLSLVVPAGAGTYVLITLLSRWLLHESVPPQRWLGVFLVTVGVALVLSSKEALPGSATAPKSAPLAATTVRPIMQNLNNGGTNVKTGLYLGHLRGAGFLSCAGCLRADYRRDAIIAGKTESSDPPPGTVGGQEGRGVGRPRREQ